MRLSTLFRSALAAAALVVAALAWAPAAEAASANQNLNMNFTVAARATLTLGTNTINFADQDPDAVPSIAATENPVSVTARVRTGSANTPTLTVLADGPLTSGTNTIPISNVTWTASAAPFIAGTMNNVTAQSAATLANGSGTYTASFSFFLANSWAYNIG